MGARQRAVSMLVVTGLRAYDCAISSVPIEGLRAIPVRPTQAGPMPELPFVPDYSGDAAFEKAGP